jgi:uncharacterized damage-inducible protein DinB
MIRRLPWFERVFPTGLPAHLLPVIIERLRGTPARLDDRLSEVPYALLVRRSGESWSIQENAGHLLDLEELWRRRVEDLSLGHAELTVADLTNSQTNEANHNAAPLEALLTALRQARRELVRQLESFPEQQLTWPALHPRLKVPMNVVDLAFFVAEHDDYHLAKISELLRDASDAAVPR